MFHENMGRKNISTLERRINMKLRDEDIAKAIECFCDTYIVESAPLSGTEKQIAWANKIREDLTKNVLKYIAHDYSHKINCTPYLELMQKVERFVLSKRQATFWIEKRNMDFYKFRELIEKTGYIEDEQKDVSIAKETKEEATVYPKQQTTKVVAEIVFDEATNRVRVFSDRDETVIKVVKDLRYKWGGVSWYYTTEPYKHDSVDRMVEVGNKLLLAGVPVLIWDKDIRQKAINGVFEDEHPYWVVQYGDNLKLIWCGKNNKLYNAAKRLPQSTWKNGGMIIPPKYYNEVRDFADINGFKISAGAETLMSEKEAEEKHINRVEIKEHIAVPIQKKGKLKDILDSSRDVIDDLIDD